MQRRDSVEPESNRLPGLFAISPLVLAVLVGLMLEVVGFGLAFRLPIVIFVLIYVFWFTPNYFFEIVEHRALGKEGWPVFSIETMVAGRSQIGVVFSLLVLVAACVVSVLGYFGMGTLAWILLVAGIVLLPGSVALLAVTREYSAALNPLRVLAASKGMGLGYLLCLAAAGAILAVIRIAGIGGGFVWYFPIGYALFLDAFLIGSVVYARRNVLGVRAPRSPEALAEKARAETVAVRHGILSHAYGFATRGNKDGALRHIDAYIAAEENTLEARLWFLDQTARWEDPYVALVLGRQLVDYCEQRGFHAELVRVRVMCEHLTARRNKGAADRLG